MKSHLFVVSMIVLLLLIGCGSEESVAPTLPPPTETITPEIIEPTEAAVAEVLVEETAVSLSGSTPITQPAWWDDAIFYEVFVRSFADSDGDGVGDLPGLIANLDYLNDGDPATTDDLGVTGIWLMPIMQSPSYHGYDVVDYYQIDDEYGTNEDFVLLMEEAHKRGINVIVDLVMNHTSDQHPWFQESRDPASDKRDWYVWNDAPTENENLWHPDGGSNYYGYFWGGMPDLNYENPDVTAEMQEIIRFWLEDMGVDGYRLDAIKHLIEDGRIVENTPATHEWLATEFYPFYKEINSDALTVGEVWSIPADVVPYVGDEVDIAFEFGLSDGILDSATSERKVNIERAQDEVTSIYPSGQYATFLANHDQNRVRSRVLNDEQAKIAATLQLMSPGVPFIYYGEEIGMQGTKPDENIRRPMQWDGTGGFSEGTPWNDYYEDYTERHVAGQSGDSESLWNHYRTLIGLRNEYAALRSGGWTAVSTDSKNVYAFMRYDENETILVVTNLWRNPAESVTLTMPASPLTDGQTTTLLMGEGEIVLPSLDENGGFEEWTITEIPPYSSLIVRFTE